MIRVRQVKISLNGDLKTAIAKKLNISKNDILEFNILKESIDSRRKPDIYLIYEVSCILKDEKHIIYNNDILKYEKKEYNYEPKGLEKAKRPIIVGAGPAGLFASYMLALKGYKPIIIERGKKIEDRVEDVDNFLKTGVLNTDSNVQFGEGGAGTFSDGKLNTMVKDERISFVLETFYKFGAPKEILYEAKPHIGTDRLIEVIKNMRDEIINLGGEFRYNSKLTDISVKDNKIDKVVLDNEYIDTDILVIAIGHSARDTFYMLNKYLKMEAKPFAVGIRIQHNQAMIDQSQYGATIPRLGPASYKLTYQTKSGRGVYTFCMCPGGYVINASSEDGMLAINGMSNLKRESDNANSAVIVTVSPNDFGNNPLDGIEYQRDLEKKAYSLGNGLIPTQIYKDFKENKVSVAFGKVKPLFKGKYKFADINLILPDYISDSLKEGIDAFGKKIQGFDSDDAIISAIESRTSSPVRILRDDTLVSNVIGIYPCGEGAGYAGGITSASVDGIKVAEAIMDKYCI